MKLEGWVTLHIDHFDSSGNSSRVTTKFKNEVLKTGRSAMAKVLTGEASIDDVQISKMIFGESGAVDGVPKYVQAERTGLFGAIRATKGVTATTDASIPGYCQFIAVLRKEDAVDVTINEMALVMANDDLFSMATFAGTTKTANMQLTYMWEVYLL